MDAKAPYEFGLLSQDIHSIEVTIHPSNHPLLPYSSRKGLSGKPVAQTVNYSFSLIFHRGICTPTNNVADTTGWHNELDL